MLPSLSGAHALVSRMPPALHWMCGPDRIGTCCKLLLTTDTPCPTRVSDILAHARLFVCVKKCVAQDAHLHVESTDARKK